MDSSTVKDIGNQNRQMSLRRWNQKRIEMVAWGYTLCSAQALYQ